MTVGPRETGGRSRPGRRAVLGAGGLAALAAGAAVLTTADARTPGDDREAAAGGAVAFHGPHQAGILTRRQSHATSPPSTSPLRPAPPVPGPAPGPDGPGRPPCCGPGAPPRG
ncbi:hypothetical protein [Streptomyces goshikiensis]|uniref:hypothetical protein n=1 Tax=Streptomyces goshikiensis TaxID=1942 RepID=UPI00268C374F